MAQAEGKASPSREGSERREAGLVAQGAVRTTSSLCSAGGTGLGTEGQHSSFPDLAMSVGHRGISLSRAAGRDCSPLERENTWQITAQPLPPLSPASRRSCLPGDELGHTEQGSTTGSSAGKRDSAPGAWEWVQGWPEPTVLESPSCKQLPRQQPSLCQSWKEGKDCSGPEEARRQTSPQQMRNVSVLLIPRKRRSSLPAQGLAERLWGSLGAHTAHTKIKGFFGDGIMHVGREKTCYFSAFGSISPPV